MTVLRSRRLRAIALASALIASLTGGEVGRPTASAAHVAPTVDGPIPGAPPGDPTSAVLEDTYPFFATWLDLADAGYVEEEFYLAGAADAWTTSGELVGEHVPYRTRIVVRRPAAAADFNGTVLMEWQNVTAGYDLDALWSQRYMRSGFAWVGVSAQRVGVQQLTQWSPTRYGDLDVTGDGEFMTDELSYDVFAQAATAVRAPADVDPMGGLNVERVLAIGASQSAGRMTTYYNAILPQVAPVFDGYGFIVGPAPSRVGPEPVMHVLSETDVRTPLGRRADSDVYRRWEVAGTAHSGYEGQVYRAPLSERDLGGVTTYQCTNPHFSRVPLGQVVAASFEHLDQWVAGGTPPPHAPYLEFTGLTTKARNELGLALGGIQLSQVAAPTALNTGDNSGPSFCFLFGTHIPFDDEQLRALYRNHGSYVSAVSESDAANVAAGYLLPADAELNQATAAGSAVGKR